MVNEMEKFWFAVWAAFGLLCLAAPLGGCMSTAQTTAIATGVVAGNTAGAAIAGVIQPVYAIPAAAVGAIANTAVCGISAALGGGC